MPYTFKFLRDIHFVDASLLRISTKPHIPLVSTTARRCYSASSFNRKHPMYGAKSHAISSIITSLSVLYAFSIILCLYVMLLGVFMYHVSSNFAIFIFVNFAMQSAFKLWMSLCMFIVCMGNVCTCVFMNCASILRGRSKYFELGRQSHGFLTQNTCYISINIFHSSPFCRYFYIIIMTQHTIKPVLPNYCQICMFLVSYILTAVAILFCNHILQIHLYMTQLWKVQLIMTASNCRRIQLMTACTGSPKRVHVCNESHEKQWLSTYNSRV